MNGKQRILTALQRKQPDCIPTFEWFIDDSVGEALTGRTDPIDIVEQLDLDGINIRCNYQRRWIDDKTYADEWGITRQVTGDCLPATMQTPIGDIRRHHNFPFPDPAAPHRFQTLERALDRFGDERAVILNLRDGWSDMRELLGYEQALMGMMGDPQPFDDLLERVIDYNLALAETARQRFGIEVIATTDDVAMAEGLIMGPDCYFQMLGPSFKRVIGGYRELGYSCIKHCDGDVIDVIEFWIDAGIDCIDPVDPGAGMRMDRFRRDYGDRICLKGNIDCAGVLCSGTPDQVAQAVRDCIDQAGRAGLILSSSNTIHRDVRPENYRAMLDALRAYG